MMHLPKTLPALLFGTLAVGCAKLEITNDSSSTVDFQVGYFDGDAVPPTRTLEPGETGSYSVNVPLGQDPVIVGTGEFVYLDTTFPRDAPFSIQDNAGAVRLTNTTAASIGSIWFRSAEEMDAPLPLDLLQLLILEWGDPTVTSLGVGETVEVPAMPIADDYLLKYDDSIRLVTYETTVGEYTEITL